MHHVADRVSELLCFRGCRNGGLERVFEFGDAGNGSPELGLERGRRAAIHGWLRFVESRRYGSAAVSVVLRGPVRLWQPAAWILGALGSLPPLGWNDLESGGRWHWLQPIHFPLDRALLAIPDLALANRERLPGRDLQFVDAARGLGFEVHEPAIGEGVEHLGAVPAVNVAAAVILEC